MFLHALMQGGPGAIRRAIKSGIEPKHLGAIGGEHYKTYAFIQTFIGAERSPNEAEIYTAIDVEVPECDWDCDIDIYSEAVRKQFLRGELMEGLDKVISETEGDPDRGRDMLQELFLGTTRGGKQDEVRTNSPETINGIRSRYQLRKERRLEGRLVGLSTPWESWSKRCKGYQKGEITTLLAATGIGKTQIAVVQANHTWNNDLEMGENVLFISLETMRETLLDRLASVNLKLDYERMTTGHLTGPEEDQLNEFCDRMEKPDKLRPELVFYGNEVKSVEDITLRCKEHQPSLVIVDGLYLINSHMSRMPRWERITNAIEQLRFEVAVGCNVPVLLTSQFNKDDKAKYASSIFDSSSVVLGLHGADEEGPGTSRTLVCMKANEFKIPFGLRINFKMDTGDYSELEAFEGEDGIFGSGDEMAD